MLGKAHNGYLNHENLTALSNFVSGIFLIHSKSFDFKKMFACDKCNKVYTTKTKWANHRRLIHGVRKVKKNAISKY
jgi:hypothetical protein